MQWIPQTLAACGSQAWLPLVISFTMDLTSQALHTGVVTYIHCKAIHYILIILCIASASFITCIKNHLWYKMIHKTWFYLQVLQSSPSSPLDQPESAELARWHNCFFFLGFVASGPGWPGDTIVFCFVALPDQVLLFSGGVSTSSTTCCAHLSMTRGRQASSSHNQIRS